jgi:hypothetical protein
LYAILNPKEIANTLLSEPSLHLSKNDINDFNQILSILALTLGYYINFSLNTHAQLGCDMEEITLKAQVNNYVEWISRENSVELIELSMSINTVRSVWVSSCSNTGPRYDLF